MRRSRRYATGLAMACLFLVVAGFFLGRFSHHMNAPRIAAPVMAHQPRQAVPEPSTFAGCAGVLLCLLATFRRSRG